MFCFSKYYLEIIQRRSYELKSNVYACIPRKGVTVRLFCGIAKGLLEKNSFRWVIKEGFKNYSGL